MSLWRPPTLWRQPTLSSSAEAALRQAEAEGLTLLRYPDNSTGFRCVSFRSGMIKPYQANVYRGGKKTGLGSFATAEEAALCYARSPEGQAAAAAPPALTAEAAVRQAEAEGLTLLPSESSSTGYRGVVFKSGGACKRKPYEAQVRRGGTTCKLGYFATAEEAALCYARTPEAQAAAAAPPPPTAEEAVRQAEAEGLALLPSESSSTGYKGVFFDSRTRHVRKPYVTRVRRGGKHVYLGNFATPEEAALHVARDSAAQAAAPQPPAASSRKRKVSSEEQPPDVSADVVVILDGRFVDGVSTLEDGSAGW